MFDTERTWLAWLDLMSAHLDLQPAIAACRTASTGSLIGALHRGGQLSVQIIRLVSGIAHFNTIERRRPKHIIGGNYAVDLPVPPLVEAKYFRCLRLAMGIVCMAMIANLLTAGQCCRSESL